MIRALGFRSFLAVLLLLTLSSCASKEALLDLVDFTEDDLAQDIELMDSEISSVPPQELLPQPVETEKCIAEELDALEKTGSWTEKENPVPPEEELKYDFPVVMNKQVKMYLDLFQNKQKVYFQRWLARSTRYKDLIHKELEEAGLPKDLLYLAMIESGFSQRAYSRARATGLWQFMRGTGRYYNLKIDRYVDERRDALKSTRAAVKYLGDLYEQFNDWHLAVAAYNGGPGTIRKGIKRYKTTDFWELAEKKRYLRLETKMYVPKLIAAIIIAKEPEKYGFTNVPYEEPLQYDTLEVGPGFSLDALAIISGGTKQELRHLNQELKSGKTPLNRRKYLAHIPKGSIELAKTNLPRLHSVVKTGYKTHITRKSESLASICRKYNINKTTLLKVNNLRSASLQHGQRLRIPYSMVDYQLLPENTTALAQSGDSLILHTIKAGETVSKIAKQYGVPADMIVTWNGLKSVHKIRAGQQLALYIIHENNNIASSRITPKTVGFEDTAEIQPSKNLIVLTETNKSRPQTEVTEATELSDDQEYNWYHVKAGDTLWTISRRFNTSPKEIKIWNNLKSNIIHPGNRLRMKDA